MYQTVPNATFVRCVSQGGLKLQPCFTQLFVKTQFHAPWAATEGAQLLQVPGSRLRPLQAGYFRNGPNFLQLNFAKQSELHSRRTLQLQLTRGQLPPLKLASSSSTTPATQETRVCTAQLHGHPGWDVEDMDPKPGSDWNVQPVPEPYDPSALPFLHFQMLYCKRGYILTRPR